MGRKASKAMRSDPDGVFAATIFATLLFLALLLTAPADAQETQEGTITQGEKAATEATNGETSGKAARQNNAGITNSKSTSSKETSQTLQGGGQQAPAGATENDDPQTTTRAGTDLAGERARISESTTDTDEIVDRIVVPVAGCEVDPEASVVVEDDDGTQARLTNGENVTITASAGALTISGTGEDDNLGSINASGGDDPQFGTVDETVAGELVRSSGITCDRDDTGDDNVDDDDNGNGARADDLQNLTCAELLVLFRGEGQYGDDGTAVVDLNDSDVRAQIEVCLEKEIVNNPGGDLPDTGGVSLLALAVLGVVSAAAGLSVIRGSRRQG